MTVGKITPAANDDSNLGLPKSWRPICNGSSLKKIRERIIFDQIYKDSNHRNFFRSRQHEFRKSEGSKEALIITTKLWQEIVKNSLDENGNNISGINVLFFDFSEAFDRRNII